MILNQTWHENTLFNKGLTNGWNCYISRFQHVITACAGYTTEQLSYNFEENAQQKIADGGARNYLV